MTLKEALQSNQDGDQQSKFNKERGIAVEENEAFEGVCVFAFFWF